MLYRHSRTRWTVPAAAAVAVTVMTAGTASADFFEWNSSIQIGATSGIASISTSSISSPGTIILTTTNGSVLTFTANQRNTVASHLNGNIGANANFGSLGAVPSPTITDIVSVAFTYTVTLRDFSAANAPAQVGTGSIQFSGLLVGDIGGGSVGVNIMSLTMSPLLPGDPTLGFVQVAGGSNYRALLNQPTPPDGIVNGVLSANFQVTAVPAPTAAAALGLGGVACARRRRR